MPHHFTCTRTYAVASLALFIGLVCSSCVRTQSDATAMDVRTSASQLRRAAGPLMTDAAEAELQALSGPRNIIEFLWKQSLDVSPVLFEWTDRPGGSESSIAHATSMLFRSEIDNAAWEETNNVARQPLSESTLNGAQMPAELTAGAPGRFAVFVAIVCRRAEVLVQRRSTEGAADLLEWLVNLVERCVCSPHPDDLFFGVRSKILVSVLACRLFCQRCIDGMGLRRIAYILAAPTLKPSIVLASWSARCVRIAETVAASPSLHDRHTFLRWRDECDTAARVWRDATMPTDGRALTFAQDLRVLAEVACRSDNRQVKKLYEKLFELYGEVCVLLQWNALMHRLAGPSTMTVERPATQTGLDDIVLCRQYNDNDITVAVKDKYRKICDREIPVVRLVCSVPK